jgi:hypothetical protein
MLVERYIRRGDEWVLSELSGTDRVLRFESIDCEIPLERLYVKVTFEAVKGIEST